VARQNPDGSVAVLLADAEVVTVGLGGEVTLNTAGQWKATVVFFLIYLPYAIKDRLNR
jgi:hypothetical protein